ncbi:hypothetical protein JZS69_004393 [Salmonella enterica subsp. enterica serovar Muenchen]|nr:hypothetical protein [Salmonella enterica subsp. enterica serovar Muenchen]
MLQSSSVVEKVNSGRGRPGVWRPLLYGHNRNR